MPNETEQPYVYVPATEEELNNIAKALVGGAIFSTQHFPDSEELVRMTGSVFMPIGLGLLSGQHAEEFKRINAVFYEFMENAGPRSVNGYPMFMSVRIISWDDWVKAVEKYDAMTAVLH